MRLIIQIPAFNEEETLGLTLSELPRELPGIESVEWLVIDDGSSDATAEVARAYGVHHLLRFPRHRGLAAAFAAGLETAVELGADIIVNTDADNQYRAADIPKLIAPILTTGADMVVGTRPMDEIREFSGLKKFLQAFGSRVVRRLSATTVEDCTSGFRAFRRDAATRLKVFGDYTYTLETIMHAGRKGMTIVSVPIRTNRVERPSRLVKSIPSYVLRSALTCLRHYAYYRPAKVFGLPGACALLVALGLALGFFRYWSLGEGSGHLSWLVGAGALGCLGAFSLALAIVADWWAMNRRMVEGLETQLFKLRQALGTERTSQTSEDGDALHRTLTRVGAGRPIHERQRSPLAFLARRQTRLESSRERRD